MNNLYIWQNKDWPNLKWDTEKLLPLIYETTMEKSLFLGMLSTLNNDLKETSFLDTVEDEIISSSSIENIMLKRDSVRSSLLSRLGFDNAGLQNTDRYTEGAVNIVLDAILNHDRPLTKERLFGWHSQLFPSEMSGGMRITTGSWRKGEMYVVSGRMGKEVIHYEAPPAEIIENEMDVFLKFINENTDVNPLIKAAVAHFWFVTIHPFSDGNGRIARTIAEMLLARADDMDYRYYSFSAEIMNNRKEYYDVLEYCQKSTLDITRFIEYFLMVLQNAVKNSEKKLESTLEKTKFWDSVRLLPLNERQIKLINKLYDGFEGKLTTEKWAKIAKCSHSTALRDIKDLMEKGVIIEDGGKSKNTGYSLK